MAESTEKNKVGLFIDWDNLAISIAADMGGMTPDVKRIVQKAQEYGSIIVARAYAEWNTMSERLSVYRAGIEPVYAPTFRFETDPITQISRGKSLADPVMVADCIDSLHILPQITTFVMVSGDKDLIPVVRLAQLRGRKVIVIGPDLVAAVLKDMADEFVSYRSLVEPEAAERYLPSVERGREAVAPSRRQPLRPRQPVQPARTPIAPQPRPAAPMPVAPPPEEREPEAAAPELSVVYSSIVEVLQHMANTGRTRVRATNLKDQLLLRIPGFTERKYGFTKFKDLLGAAERGGLLRLSAAGPVHWVSLPEAKSEEASVRAIDVAPPVAAIQPEASVVPMVDLSAGEQERRLAVVRFIDELRLRSRWLTYTYVLTNVIGFVGRLVPASQAEAESRSILNFLVAEGALRIDKAPQEVDVGGIKHRVRMCHFVEDHDLVQEARSATLPNIPEDLLPPLLLQPASETPASIVEAVPSADAEVEGDRATAAGEPSLDLAATAPAEVGEQSDNGRPAEETLAPPIEITPAEETPPAPAPRARRGRRRPRSAAERAAEASPAVEEAPAAPAEVKAPKAQAAPAAAEKSPTADDLPPIETIYGEVRRILGDLAEQGKARVTGSSLKLRLSRTYQGFDERRYGFGKFKDFLLAAEREGHAAVDLEGQVNWVRVPQLGAEEQPAEAPTEALAEKPEALPAPESQGTGAAPEEQDPPADSGQESELQAEPAEAGASVEETPEANSQGEDEERGA